MRINIYNINEKILQNKNDINKQSIINNRNTITKKEN